MRFLLSIHDVWPGNFPQVASYLARLRSLGARRIALLVVPAYHGGSPMDEDAGFVGWLKEESAAGTELFLHGYNHHATAHASGAVAPQAGRSAWGGWINRNVAAGEAEFCGLPDADKDRLLELGVASFRRADLPLAGFVAPTWHGSPNRASLIVRGVPIHETRFAVRSLHNGSFRWAPPLAWYAGSGVSGRRLAGGETWLSALLGLPLIKVAIHPGDLENEEAEGVLRRVFRRGGGSGYAEIFGGVQSVGGPSLRD